MPSADHLHWLHLGGQPARWGNLGLWQRRSPEEDYATACARLARAVGEAAGMRAGDAVLSLACGAGEELALWAEHFGAEQVMALELSPSLAAQARQRADSSHTGCRTEVYCADASRLAQLVGGRFDRIVCVDAIYHLGPRVPLVRAARPLLAQGGGFAFTDLALERGTGGVRQAWRRLWLRLGAALAGLPYSQVMSREAQCELMRQAGFDSVQATALDAPVLEGFCAFAARQSQRIGPKARRTAAWWRVAATAWFIRLGRPAGLGYVLYSGRAGSPTDAMGLGPLREPAAIVGASRGAPGAAPGAPRRTARSSAV